MADTSLDSNHDITADLIEQTPIEKCSLNPRRGRNSRRLLTGFIIYASEVRKQVVEQYPDQNFGFISKLVGDKWKELGTDLRFKYHQRALIHNKRIKELAAREGVSLGDIDLASGSVIKAPKITKKKLAKLAKQESKRLNDSTASAAPSFEQSSMSLDTPNTSSLNTSYTINNNNFDISQLMGPKSHSLRVVMTETSTQTPCVRYVAPPPKKPLTFTDAFLKHLEALQQRTI